jgi:dihydroorotate dehydrogenase
MLGLLSTLSRHALLKLDPEHAHGLGLRAMITAERFGLLRLSAPKVPALPTEFLGLKLANPVGIAAGFDKNADAVDALATLGFGFIEVGTITPRPQLGNDKPRIFRVPEQRAIINRLGFNNLGVDALLKNLARTRYRGVLGINIGKNKDTANEDAERDYLFGLEKVFPHASYITVNISSPNTQGLRELQEKESLKRLLGALAERRERLEAKHKKRVPLLVKLAPDMDEKALKLSARVTMQSGFEGAILTNTTIDRAALVGHRLEHEAGGLSGAPLKARADQALAMFKAECGDKLALVGVGGITQGSDAADKLAAGAEVVQFYTGLIYRGPELIAECVRAIAKARA